jgi:fatty-acid desaturase
MQLAQLLIVVSLVIIGIGFRRVLRHQAAQGPVSKKALLVWLVLFIGTLLVWNWAASHRMTAPPLTINVIGSSPSRS